MGHGVTHFHEVVHYLGSMELQDLFSLLALLANFVLMLVAIAALHTSRRATDETKRSVDAYMNSQRGIVGLVGCHLDVSHKVKDDPKTEERYYRILYIYQNVGPSSIFIISRIDKVTAVPIGSKPPPVEYLVADKGEADHLLLIPEKCIISKPFPPLHKRPPRPISNLPIDIDDEVAAKVNSRTHYLLWRSSIIYRSVMGVQYFAGISMKADKMDQGQMFFVQGGGNFDRIDPNYNS
jgi:hypothetical protein